MFNFDTTYLKLPPQFYQEISPADFAQADMIVFNQKLAKKLSIKADAERLLPYLAGNKLTDNSRPLAMAYAGHQFGYFTILGDGRAILLGEQLTDQGRRFDIQLKGAGQTKYSRGGDGKATLRAMLREYVISEAMHALNIATSRSLAVVAAAEKIYRRDGWQRAARLTRVASSHLRVGTFQFAAIQQDRALLKALTDYAIERHDHYLCQTKTPYTYFFNAVVARQRALVVDWLRVGFVHGVLNTDNVTISGETLDYGPCAFIDDYDPAAVYSSIDQAGRYAFARQPDITRWNLACLAQAMAPLLTLENSYYHAALDSFTSEFQSQWLTVLCQKIGFKQHSVAAEQLAVNLLDIMKAQHMDYTNTFVYLEGLLAGRQLVELSQLSASQTIAADFEQWLEKWRSQVERDTGSEQASQTMQRVNPRLIPRNHIVEQLLDKAVQGELAPLEQFLSAMQSTYDYHCVIDRALLQADRSGKRYQTYCGT